MSSSKLFRFALSNLTDLDRTPARFSRYILLESKGQTLSYVVMHLSVIGKQQHFLFGGNGFAQLDFVSSL